jgi:hypothetical protein
VFIMSVIIKAHFDGKNIVPDSLVDLPSDQPLEVEVRLLPKKVKDSNKVIQRRSSITSLPFFGMWSDRTDIQDSTEWVNKERENWNNRHANTDS